MSPATRTRAPDPPDLVRPGSPLGRGRATISYAADPRGGAVPAPERAELLALGRTGMRLIAAALPQVGRPAIARFVLRGEPFGCAAGRVTATTGTRGVTIRFHHMSVCLRQLIDDLERLRPPLRTGFLAELIDVHVELS